MSILSYQSKIQLQTKWNKRNKQIGQQKREIMRGLQKFLVLMVTHHQVFLSKALEVFLNWAPVLFCGNRFWVPQESPSVSIACGFFLQNFLFLLVSLATSEEGFRKNTFKQLFQLLSCRKMAAPRGIYILQSQSLSLWCFLPIQLS